MPGAGLPTTEKCWLGPGPWQTASWEWEPETEVSVCCLPLWSPGCPGSLIATTLREVRVQNLTPGFYWVWVEFHHVIIINSFLSEKIMCGELFMTCIVCGRHKSHHHSSRDRPCPARIQDHWLGKCRRGLGALPDRLWGLARVLGWAPKTGVGKWWWTWGPCS